MIYKCEIEDFQEGEFTLRELSKVKEIPQTVLDKYNRIITSPQAFIMFDNVDDEYDYDVYNIYYNDDFLYFECDKKIDTRIFVSGALLI